MLQVPRLNPLDVSNLCSEIKEAKSLILTTHKQCDGDGLGSQLALYHGLKKYNKEVRVICVDAVPKKYHFLGTHSHLEIYESLKTPIKGTDLALIFDTNDFRLVEPLYSELREKCKKTLFVDHHPILNQGPEPTAGSLIETKAASTGEITYFVLKALGIRLDEDIAQALYTSLAFDTQIFRYVKGSPTSHLIAADLLQYIRKPEEIHRNLFATHSPKKIQLLAKMLSEIEYKCDEQVAFVLVAEDDLEKNNLEMDDARDIIDMIMNINTLKAAALFRQEHNGYKLSLRSNGSIEVLSIAETYGGGGHLYAAGAFLEGDIEALKGAIAKQFSQRFDDK